jgi:hypothetical protein
MYFAYCKSQQKISKMKFSEAKKEFEKRFYSWSISEFDKEIGSSFPNLGLFKTGFKWQIHQFMQRLEPDDQSAFGHAMVKRWNSETTKALGESLTDRESSLLEQFDDEFRFQPSRLESELDARRRAGEKIKFASKGKLRKAMVAKFVEAFGSQCVKMQIGPEWDPLFYMRRSGWLVVTQLWFGRQQGLISHRHSIESETRIQHPQNPEITGPTMELVPGIVWPCSGQWEYLLDSEIEPAVNAAIIHCGYFFDAVPKLLKGLEFDKIEV